MKAIATILILCFFSFNLTAQEIKESEVPKAVKEGCMKKYPNVKSAEWMKKDKNYKATFTDNKTKVHAEFDPNGNFMEEWREIMMMDVPEMARNYCSKNYEGYEMMKAFKVTDASGKVSYMVKMKKDKDYKKIEFDEKGNFMKEHMMEKHMMDDHMRDDHMKKEKMKEKEKMKKE